MLADSQICWSIKLKNLHRSLYLVCNITREILKGISSLYWLQCFLSKLPWSKSFMDTTLCCYFTRENVKSFLKSPCQNICLLIKMFLKFHWLKGSLITATQERIVSYTLHVRKFIDQMFFYSKSCLDWKVPWSLIHSVMRRLWTSFIWFTLIVTKSYLKFIWLP